MDKKTSSKPMKEIMNRLEKTSIFQMKYFSDKVKFELPVEAWPQVAVTPRCFLRFCFCSQIFP
jgi:hypothetical protein